MYTFLKKYCITFPTFTTKSDYFNIIFRQETHFKKYAKLCSYINVYSSIVYKKAFSLLNYSEGPKQLHEKTKIEFSSRNQIFF